MSYPRQVSVAKALQKEAIHAVDQVQYHGWAKLQRLWSETRQDLRNLIRDSYRHHVPQGNWDLPLATVSGARSAIVMGIASRMVGFQISSHAMAKGALNAVYRESLLRHAWVLDQVTPPNRPVRVPHRLRLYESNVVNFSQGPEAAAQFAARWSGWVGAYSASLQHNLMLGMINNSSPDDAADEVDATRAGSPSYGLIDALYRLYQSESAYSLSRGINEVAAANEDMDPVEVWQTRDNTRVCDVCDENRGLTRDEADTDIPAHPNCNCYWRLVPKSWADLLKSGDMDDQELSRVMDAKGIVPNSMVVYDDDGNVAGHVIVTFQSWMENQMKVIGQP
jgi:hypothetical protein